MSVRISVARLKTLANPLGDQCWNVPVSLEDVEFALKNRMYHTIGDSTLAHAGRIAYYVQFGWTTPIQIDVGVPCAGYTPIWLVTDGNHRLAAAIFMHKRYIEAEVSGQVDYAKKPFGWKYDLR